MTHHRITSSNIFSIGHSGTVMQARFRCGRCNATGNDFPGRQCPDCGGKGHGPTFAYIGVPRETFDRVMAGEPAELGGKVSVGAAFHRLVKSNKNFKVEKDSK